MVDVTLGGPGQSFGFSHYLSRKYEFLRLMKDEGRYNVSGIKEARFEPGSVEKVLQNLQGITDSEEMNIIEANALAEATDGILREFDQEHQFTADDICHLHKIWLGKIYQWAGQYRQVNISKGDFTFAIAAQV